MASPKPLNPVSKLTARQLEILRLVDLPKSNWAIAVILNRTENTVKKHLFHAFRTLGVYSRMEAAKLLREWEEEQKK
jgi:two-component system nitrate/nitrite response regulator NarL